MSTLVKVLTFYATEKFEYIHLWLLHIVETNNNLVPSLSFWKNLKPNSVNSALLLNLYYTAYYRVSRLEIIRVDVKMIAAYRFTDSNAYLGEERWDD